MTLDARRVGDRPHARLLVWLALALAVALASAALAAIPAEAPARPNGAKLDLRLEHTGVIGAHEYRELPPMSRRGAMGANLQRKSSFSLAHQQLGDMYVRAGLVRGDAKLIKRGFRAFDYAFRRQQRDGTFGSRQAEEYAFFVEAVAHSGLLVRASNYKRRFAKRLRRYERKLRPAAAYMIEPGPWEGFRSRNPSYTHNGYTVGTALALAQRFAGGRQLKRFAERALRMSLSRQRGSGVNPELGGYDVRYQMAGLVYAERYRVYFPRGQVARRVDRMVVRGLRWMTGRVADSGYIRWQGSTRTCKESSSTGNPKTPGYHHAIRGFAYWGRREGRGDLNRAARRMHQYSSRVTGRSLCGEERKPRRGGGGDGGDGGGGEFDDLLPDVPVLEPRLAQDLYE